jgi:hypothetical protein
MYFRDNNGKIIVEGYDQTSTPSYLTAGQKTALTVFIILIILLVVGGLIYRKKSSNYY